MLRIKQYRKIILYLVASFLPFFMCGCDTVTQVFYPEVPKETLDKICEARGGLDSPGPLYVDGYYQPLSGPMFGYGQVEIRLTKARFQYFEMDSDGVKKGFNWSDYNVSKIKGSGRYTRFYVAELGDPNCEAFKDYFRFSHKRAEKKLRLRAYGLYPDHCIAAIRTDERKSKYGLSLRKFQDPELPELTWRSTEVRELPSDKIYASNREFTFCRQGRKKNGKCRGGRKNKYTCPSAWQDANKNSDAIYYETFKSTPNSILEKTLTTINVWEPVSIDIDWVEPELVEVLEGKENIKKLINDEVLDLYMSKDAEGYAYFSSRRLPWEVDPKRDVDQKQLWAIRQEDRSLLKIDVGIENPHDLKKGFFNYCCIRAIPGDGIYFIAWGGRNERYIEANHFRILRYNWDGKLTKMTAGTLPFTFITEGDPYQFYGKLKIEKGYYSFSVLETFKKDKSGGRSLHPSKEYRFRVPRD